MKYLMLMLFLSACTSTLKHEIELDLNLADDCLTSFPVCDGDGYYCERPDGARAYDCEVNCLAASSRLCRFDGPVCLQLGEEVPVFCLEKL